MKIFLIALAAWCGLAMFLTFAYSFLKRHERRADRRDNNQ